MTAASWGSHSAVASHGEPLASSSDSNAPKAIPSISSKVLSASSTDDLPEPGAPVRTTAAVIGALSRAPTTCSFGTSFAKWPWRERLGVVSVDAQLVHDVRAVDKETARVLVGIAQHACHRLPQLGFSAGILGDRPRSEGHRVPLRTGHVGFG